MSSQRTDTQEGRINLFDPAFTANPQPVYQELHKKCPVAHTAGVGGRALTRYEDVLFALRHPENFSSAMGAARLGNVRPLIPLQIDPPELVKYRKLLDPLFSHKKSLEMAPDMRKLANQLIDAFIDTGECEFTKDFAIPYPCTVIVRLMGLPQEDLDLLLELKNGIVRPTTTDYEEATRLRAETAQRIYAYFEKVLDLREKKSGEDLISYFLAAEVGGERLTRNDVLDICFLFLLGGLDTVTASLGCGFAYLATHPEQRRLIVEDPSLIPTAAEELLRWDTPVMGVARVVKQDVTIGDVELKAGESVTVLLGAADVDEQEFPEANRVDFRRERNRHLAFGGGAHRCLGSHLSRVELCVAYEEFHRRIPEYQLKTGEEPKYGLGIREVQHLPLVFGDAAASGGQKASE
ncbi:MAG: cytochrome P450 [Myxococcota bacterium]|jgi:cytochrome P450|nr:cytochrome [Deltaproteobacteria bacterium]MCP4239026.1 cytochrome P450 [bacterium]MDP6074012.1 cytochrome P450 [Myxococcota bacterium]MDP6243203.1 cytochrome P450 [Myxococcota bacterium]MDP7075570.1 cytochrome P450 [Myxococcota bacterium]